MIIRIITFWFASLFILSVLWVIAWRIMVWRIESFKKKQMGWNILQERYQHYTQMCIRLHQIPVPYNSFSMKLYRDTKSAISKTKKAA